MIVFSVQKKEMAALSVCVCVCVCHDKLQGWWWWSHFLADVSFNPFVCACMLFVFCLLTCLEELLCHCFLWRSNMYKNQHMMTGFYRTMLC